MQIKCPIFKSLGIRLKGDNKCAECPLTSDCPQDIMDDAVMRILKNIGRYVHEARKKNSSHPLE